MIRGRTALNPARTRLLRAAAAFLLVAASAAAAVSVDEAEQAYAAKNYKKARLLYGRLAEQGDAKAQDRFGDLYYDGLGVKKDLASARRWYEASSRQGLASGEYHFADMLQKGDGGPKDAPRALGLFKQAYAKNISLAAAKICALYSGDSVEVRDYREAMGWCLKVEELPYAQFLMARLYEGGFGVPKDEARAFSLYESAARTGHWAFPANNVAYMALNGIGTAKDPARAYLWYVLGAPAADDEDRANLRKLEAGLDAGQKSAALREKKAILGEHKALLKDRDVVRQPNGF